MTISVELYNNIMKQNEERNLLKKEIDDIKDRYHELFTCMCGMEVDSHNAMEDGHVPISMYDYYEHLKDQEIKELRRENESLKKET